MASPTPPIVQEAVKRWDESQDHHRAFVRRYERGEKAYRGVLEASSDAARWRHKYAPSLAFGLIEQSVASTVEMGLRFNVRPAPHSQAPLDEVLKMAAQADVVGELLRHEHRVDGMEFKQRPLFLSAAICGIGVGKTYWNWTTGQQTRQKSVSRPVHDDAGNHLGDVPVIESVSEMAVVRDHSTFEVVDPRDFVTHEAARALQPWEPGGAQYLFHRCWYSYDQLKMMEASGFLKNVDDLKDNQRDFSEIYNDREKQVWQINRTKDMLEVLEYWKFDRGTIKRCWIGNRSILLRDLEDNPFNHRDYPFVIASSMAEPFSTMHGFSDIEFIEQLQSMVWELTNQRLDNVELINNWITLIRSDVDDPDAFQFYPGAFWPVESMDQVSTLQPPYQLVGATLEAEALIRGDLQNVTSAGPFASGAMSQGIDQKTATGVSMIMNAAQRRLEFKKYLAQQGLRQEANMRIKNCQQFITDARLLHVLGEDGKTVFKEINPLDIQGDFIAELTPMGESSMRQERRAEGTQLTQVLLQAAPLAAAAGTPINVKEVLTQFLEDWGHEDADRFFSQQAPAMGAMGAPGGIQPAPGMGMVPPGSGPPLNPLGNMGITAGSAVDARSPSAAGGIGGSPVMAMQRALAMRGGAANARR